MSTRFKGPFQAWEEAEMRSVDFGVAGFLVVWGYPHDLQEYSGSRRWRGEWVLNSPDSIAITNAACWRWRSRTFLDSTSRSKSVVSESLVAL